MSRLKKLSNHVFVFVIFLLTSTRLTVARILPFARTSQKPNPSIFALTEAAWAELRAGVDFRTDDEGASKSSDDKKDASKSDDKKDAAKSDDKKDASKGDDKKDASKTDDKKDAGEGGGDGVVADGVGG